MAKKINSSGTLQAYLSTICYLAVENTAKTAGEKLKECIKEQYYDDPGFYPDVYKRTEQFLGHAAYQLLSNNTAKIYVDTDGMHYKNNFDPWQVVSWASESKHGADYYQTDTADFWTVFTDWCNENLINILKDQLRKYGLKPR